MCERPVVYSATGTAPFVHEPVVPLLDIPPGKTTQIQWNAPDSFFWFQKWNIQKKGSLQFLFRCWKEAGKKDISCTCGWKNICTITFCFYMIRGCHQQTMKQKDSLEVIRESSRLCLFEIQRASGISVKAWACLLRYGKNMTMYLRRCLRSLNKETDGSD